jgi:Peptidase A4 family
MKRTIVCFLMAVLPSLLVVGTQSAFADACTDFNQSAATLEGCGYVVNPLQSVQSLPGGGQVATYQLASGGTTQERFPPAGFEPLAATNAQLQEYGFPLPPSGDAYTSWFDSMADWKTAGSPGPFIVTDPDSHAANYDGQSLWGGFSIEEPNGTITGGGATWTQPSYGHTTCGADNSYIWAGIDGVGYGGPLVQGGTVASSDGNNNRLFWETTSATGVLFFSNNPISSAGDSISSYIAYDGSNNYSIYVEDNTNGQSGTEYPNVSGYAGNSFEAIGENPQGTNAGIPGVAGLTDWYTNGSSGLKFSTAYVSDSMGSNTFNNIAPASSWGNPNNGTKYQGRDGLWIKDGDGDTMADTNNIGSNGAFTETQHSCTYAS